MKVNQPSLQTPPSGQAARLAAAHAVTSPPARCKGVLSLCLLLLTLGTSPAQLGVTEGLVLRLSADANVATDGNGFVNYWADQSAGANDAFQTDPLQAPLLVPNAVNGLPALRFDGTNSYLEIANTPSLRPGMGDWTVFFVAKRGTASQGDFPPVIGSRLWETGMDLGWGVGFDGAGLVCSHYADGASGHDVPAVRSGIPLSSNIFQFWMVEENRAVRTTSLYSGETNRVLVTVMPVGAIEQPNPIYIGRDLSGANNRRANLDLAEVLVYNRVLSLAERDSVAAYLSGKYNVGFSPNTPPTVSVSSPANDATFTTPATFDITADPFDSDGSISQVEFFVGQTRVATATQPPFTAPVKILTAGAFTLTAAATDNRGERTISSAINITVTGGGPPWLEVQTELRLWLSADANVATDGNGFVNYWADQSPNANDAAQADPAVAPWLVNDAINSKPVLRFDGTNSFLGIANALSLQPQSGDWTVFFVGQRRPGSQGDWPEIIGSRPWNAGLDKGWAVVFGSTGVVSSHYADGTTGHDVNGAGVPAASVFSQDNFQIWQVEENRGAATTTYYTGGVTDRRTTPMPSGLVDQTDPVYIGREMLGSNDRRASMDLAEVLVYGAALSTADRESVTAYLGQKYGLPAVIPENIPPTVAFTSPADGANFVVPAELTLTAAPVDSDGSIALVRFYRGANLLGTATQEPYSVTVSNAYAGTVVYTAVAIDNLGAAGLANVTITNITLNPPAEIDAAHGLISEVDYADTFTVNTPARSDGLYNNNGDGGYNIETTYSNPAATWTPFSNFSFNSGGTTCCGYPGDGANPGAASGVAQSGGNDFSIAYGLRQSYVVSVDAILPGDRLDISSMPAPGATIFSAGSLSIFFRRDTASLPYIGVFNGTTETPSGVQTGVTDNNWHNYAVHFDKPFNRLGLYVDGVLKTNLDLTTFAGGIYADYSNTAVGLGGSGPAGVNVFWADNFRVGAPGRRLHSIDFRDTFTVGSAARPDGLYNDNAGGGYNVESDPGRTWTPFGSFSFNSAGTTCCGYPGNAGNAEAASGLAQSGGGDFSFAYGVRQNYVVEVDAVLPGDRFDISSMPAAGAGLFSPNSLTVFFRKDGSAAPGIGLFNGSAEANSGATTGVTDNNWHRYSVHFDQVNHRLGLYVDGVLKANLDLATFAGGAYADYSNAAVGLGGSGPAGVNVFWADNFMVGPPEVELVPGPLSIQRVGTDVSVSWTGSGLLESADDLAGPWTPITDARGLLTTTPGTMKFYRLRH